MQKRKKLLWQLFQSYLAITLLSLITVILFATESLNLFYTQQLEKTLVTQAELFKRAIPADFSVANAPVFDRLCREIGLEAGIRFTVIRTDGTVIGDTDEDFHLMANHNDRPEIIQALAGKVGTSRRFSSTLNQNFMYVGIPVFEGNAVVGVVRSSLPVSTISVALKSMHFRLAESLIIIGLLAAVVSYLVSRKLNRRIVELIRGADHFAEGNLSFRITMSSVEELDNLAIRMNAMAALLDERIGTITEQRNTIEAVLSGMSEAVFAIDDRECVIEYNEAAEEKLFHKMPGIIKGKDIHQVIRNTHILRFMDTVMTIPGETEDEITLSDEKERVLQAHGAQLHTAEGKRMGAVFVFNDITSLKRLENMRREFVANVSHELKTPITSITGFLETMSGDEVEKSEEISRFLTIVLKNAKRLNSIVDDLLSLSRLEQKTEKEAIDFDRIEVRGILDSAMALYDTKLREKEMNIELACDHSFINGNATLMVQAVGNLIDNAIKYSEKNGLIQVSAHQQDATVMLQVKDTGKGIPLEHQSRIFERFYRVDKSRSRELGGTGLGLSIVKHIVLTHGGSVSVESQPGKGSTFTLTLPAA